MTRLDDLLTRLRSRRQKLLDRLAVAARAAAIEKSAAAAANSDTSTQLRRDIDEMLARLDRRKGVDHA